MKHLLTLFFIVGLFFSASAQQQDSKYKVSVGGELMSALGSTAEFYNIGYGASAQGEYRLSPKLSATLSGAYIIQTLNKVYKEIFLPWSGPIGDKTFYVGKAGAKYNFYKRYYAAAEGGVAISKDKVARGNSFAYAAIVGTSFEISKKSSIDVGIRFEEWAVTSRDRLTFGGVRAAYVFGFGKTN
jgi:hypothetical protein